jgi:hypothetical protein
MQREKPYEDLGKFLLKSFESAVDEAEAERDSDTVGESEREPWTGDAAPRTVGEPAAVEGPDAAYAPEAVDVPEAVSVPEALEAPETMAVPEVLAELEDVYAREAVYTHEPMDAPETAERSVAADVGPDFDAVPSVAHTPAEHMAEPFVASAGEPEPSDDDETAAELEEPPAGGGRRIPIWIP